MHEKKEEEGRGIPKEALIDTCKEPAQRQKPQFLEAVSPIFLTYHKIKINGLKKLMVLHQNNSVVISLALISLEF